jgi:hypothetical protein
MHAWPSFGCAVRVTFGEQGRGVKAEAWAVANPSTRCMHASLLPKILTTNVKKILKLKKHAYMMYTLVCCS